METLNNASSSCSIRRVRQVFVTFVATIGIFGLGTVLAYTSPALPSIAQDHEFNKKTNSNKTTVLSIEESSWTASIAMLGALVASPLAGLLADSIGRKRSMLLFSLPFIGSWILVATATTVTILLSGRFLTGFCGGAYSLIAPVYISEISENNIRGTLLSLFQLMLVAGILFTYCTGSVLNWRNLAWVSGIVPLSSILMLLFIPESPRYYVQKDQQLEAEKSLKWLRQSSKVTTLNDDTNEIQTELEKIRISVTESQSGERGFLTLFKPHIVKPISVCLSLMVFEQISGFNAIVFYAVGIFEAAGSSLDPTLASVIVGVVQVVATIVSSVLVDRVGRRILLLFPQILMSLSLFALGLFFILKNQEPEPSYLPNIKWIPLVSMTIFIIAFSLGIGPLSWTMMGELLPPYIKGRCSSIATALVWICAFFVTKSFDTVAHALGIYWCFWAFGICCIAGFISIYLTVPETKGKSLELIQKEFIRTET